MQWEALLSPRDDLSTHKNRTEPGINLAVKLVLNRSHRISATPPHPPVHRPSARLSLPAWIRLPQGALQ